MRSVLTDILQQKKKEICALKERGVPLPEGGPFMPGRDFKGAISAEGRIHLIAEIKFASPSAGRIRERTDPVSIGRIYEKNGASALSVLTDRRFFGGDLKDLPRLKEAVSLPILRKDFMLDEIQIEESYRWGADAVLLIARILSYERLSRLVDACSRLGLTPLTEVHDEEDLRKVVSCGGEIIGINNRDLDTLEVDLATTLRLSPLVPEEGVKVSASGIQGREDLDPLKGAGVAAVLVGTGLMKSGDLGEKVRELAEGAVW